MRRWRARTSTKFERKTEPRRPRRASELCRCDAEAFCLIGDKIRMQLYQRSFASVLRIEINLLRVTVRNDKCIAVGN